MQSPNSEEASSHKNKRHYLFALKYLLAPTVLGVLIVMIFCIIIPRFTNAKSSYSITVTPKSQNLGMPTENKPIALTLEAHNVYVLDQQKHATIYEANATEKIAPASTTKLITALTVLDSCALDDKVVVGKEISYVAADASKADLKVGNILTVKQLLEALLLPSGNDAAYVLANHTGHILAGSNSISDKDAIRTFVKAMNQKARDLGGTSTNFSSPDGYDAPGQYSTAKDLACFASQCLKVDCLKKIMNSCEINETLLSGEKVVYTNTNHLIDRKSKYYCKHVTGLKTGSSDKAGYCVISSFKDKKHDIVSVVMKSSKDGRFKDSKKIYDSITQAK